MTADPVKSLIDAALAEDIGPGDITTELLIPSEAAGVGTIIAKEELVVAGLHVARQVFARLDPAVRFDPARSDGDVVAAGTAVAVIRGPLRALLTGERTALNFLQRLSGIATQTRAYVSALGTGRAVLVDTRKTTPGWRYLEKYAVRVGGAKNHRMGLFDGVLIKDNHIAVSGGIQAAVQRARSGASHLLRIEVEVESLQEVEKALAAGADVIMLDNMDLPTIRTAVDRIAGRATVEVSGGVTNEGLAALADAGVDLISSGALTHSARSVDLSMRITHDSDP
jgi:nicotinate-nucleotide pyrophosphorylase (carboxylating)